MSIYPVWPHPPPKKIEKNEMKPCSGGYRKGGGRNLDMGIVSILCLVIRLVWMHYVLKFTRAPMNKEGTWN